MFAFKRLFKTTFAVASLIGLLAVDGGAVRGQTWRQEGRIAARVARQAGRTNARTFGDYGTGGYTTYYAPGGYYAGPTYYRPGYAVYRPGYAGGYYAGPAYNGGYYGAPPFSNAPAYGGPAYGAFTGPRPAYYNPAPVSGPGAYAAAPLPRAYLGVIMSDTPDGVVVVTAVRPNSPAEQAGIQPGDVLMSIDGREIFTPQDVTRMVARHAPGEAVRLAIDRNGKNDQIEAVVASTGVEPVVEPVVEPAASGPQPTLAPANENAATYESLPAPSQARRAVIDEFDAN